MAQARAGWHDQLAAVDLNRLVFLDESGASTNLVRRYGRGPRGQRVRQKVPHGHWKTATLVAAVRSSGPLAPALFDGPLDAASFRAYVEQVLAPSLTPGDVVVMDNLASHKAAGIAEAIAQAGAQLVYLPPYSPDYNPIECMWSKVKGRLRSAAARSFEALCDACAAALQAVTASDCRGFFANCGYAT